MNKISASQRYGINGHVVAIAALGLLAVTAWNSTNINPSPLPKPSKKLPLHLSGQFGTYRPKSHHVTPEFVEKVEAIALSLKTKPQYLMAVMGFETGGTFSPSIQNPVSKATGLIQFMSFTAKSLGTSTSALAKMSAVAQLDYVSKYLQPFQGKLNTLPDVYAAVLFPIAVGKDENFVLFWRGTVEYKQNRGFDTNKDGKITLGEASTLVRKFLPHQSVFE